MESLNLNTLVNSLPNGQQNAEKELLNDFKAAALSITTLYRSSRKNSKRAYNNGYSTACQDMLNFIQQGVSASDIGLAPSGTSHAVEGGGMTIGRVMDWIEARVDAIRAREEEEEEDEEREKDKERAPRPAAERPVAGPVAAKSDDRKASPAASAGSSKAKATSSSLPTPSSPVSGTTAPSAPTSPSPPPLSAAPRHKASKGRPTPTKESFHPTPQSTHFSPPTFISEPFPVSHSQSSIPFAETPVIINAGSKRRHAMMMMLDSNSPAISIGGPSSAVSSPGGTGTANGGAHTSSSLGRRRTRNSRNLQPHNSNISVVQMAPEEMDIEEDGRERKRVARR
ncbi:hypothetical protein HYPSUDRAFT_63772 [Hypholoma sublateritium FD-334 SS-4]|uniref:Uncharacterized protein n=1 Tax=Hypholoma sublateritium (strain FD-334 SS-4) TaxID=945553 RepID=A0A0D2MR74_HYPSF|nr:hypothetical protein HYPSUDRAFT_63772 [Hypholoma sublateritium FD-334 SS-4]